MDNVDTREWLLTNGLGSFASGTICDARTRTYHGWLTAALNPPGRRMLLLSHVDASLEIAGQIFSLGTNFWTDDEVGPTGYQLLQSFTVEPIPTWIWGQADWQISRQIVMPFGLGGEKETGPHTPARHRVLVQYRYQGSDLAIVRLRPLIADRDFHHLQSHDSGKTFSQILGNRQVMLQALQNGKAGTLWTLGWSQGYYQPEGAWYWHYYYPEEAQRGLDYQEDLYSPGYLTVMLQPGDALTVEASVGLPSGSVQNASFDRAIESEQQRIHLLAASSQASTEQRLRQASDRFITYHNERTDPRIVAGYHWFGDRSRDSLLCLPGLALTTGNVSLARFSLARLGRLCCQGLIPNVIPDSGDDPVFQSIDCSLWWIEMLGLYVEATQDWDFLIEQYAVVKQIYKAFIAGTLHAIRIDASDGLITWDDDSVALTWMNTTIDGKPITPRNGKPIEVNALWYSALSWASDWASKLAQLPSPYNVERLQNQANRYQQQAAQVRASLQRFWNPKRGYLFDRIKPDDRLDGTIRPNAVLSLSLHHCAFSPEIAASVLQVASDRLLTPYGLRSLDPADSAYIGRYTGNPYQRDLAAHQGTVWSWLLGPFLRAWVRTHAEDSPPVDLQPLLTHFEEHVCLNAISELFDGDAPHEPRGCVASAIAIAELLRFWNLNPSN